MSAEPIAAERYMRSNRITDAELREYEPAEAEHSIKSILEYDVDVMAMLNGEDKIGELLPWTKTHGVFRMRPGEVTLWHGMNGHGKSAVTGQVALWLALHEVKVCLASFEMLPKRTLYRMVKQAAGNGSPPQSFVSSFFIGLCQTMWVYDRRGRIDPEMLFKAIRYAAETKGTKHFFVDSLMKCVPKEDDYGAQADFVNAVCDIAHETGNHIHLIHHTRKAEDERRQPGKFDAKGTGAITDQVDNVIGVWKDKAKERERETCAEMGAAFDDAKDPDFVLICDKQRNGTWEGRLRLWGDGPSMHFRQEPKSSWMRGYEIPGYARKQEEPGALG